MNARHGYSDLQWQTLHQEIQARLRSVAEQVKACAPSLDLAYGKTVTERFPLFSFLRFKPGKGSGREDTLMGIELVPDGPQQWRLDADVAAEESGEIYFELPSISLTATNFEEFRAGVLRTVDQLVSGGKPALLRLFGSSALAPSSPAAVLPDVARKG